MSPSNAKAGTPPADEVPGSKANGGKNHQLKVLYRISDLINSTVNNATLLRRIVRETVEAFEASGGFIAFPNSPGSAELLVEVDQRMDGRNLRTGTALPVDHLASLAYKNARLQHAETQKPAPTTRIAAPLRVEGKVMGVLCVRWARIRRVTDSDERLLTAIAAQAARIIHTSRLYERLTRQTHRLESLFEIGQTLISTDPLPEVLNRVTESLLNLLDVKQCTVLLVGKGHDLQMSASSGGTGNYTQRRELGDSLMEKLSSRGEPVRVLNVKKMPDRKPGKAPKADRTTSLLAVPIFYQQTLVGILNVYTEQPRNFEGEEMRLLKSYASLCGVAIQNARQHEKLLSAAEEIRQADRANTIQALTAEGGLRIRNALTSTELMLDALHEEGALPPGFGEDYEALKENLETIDKTVASLQDMAARRALSFEWIDINSAVDDVLSMCRHRLAARQIKVHTRLLADLPRVLADLAEIQQVILQGVTNAMEGMRHGGLLNVSTTLLEPAEGDDSVPMVRINLRDTGPGIDPSAAESLLDPFSRPSGVASGTGLFVASRVVQKYGGRFTIRNASDHGTSLSITLPALES